MSQMPFPGPRLKSREIGKYKRKGEGGSTLKIKQNIQCLLWVVAFFPVPLLLQRRINLRMRSPSSLC